LIVTRNKLKSFATFYPSWVVHGSGRVGSRKPGILAGRDGLSHDFRGSKFGPGYNSAISFINFGSINLGEPRHRGFTIFLHSVAHNPPTIHVFYFTCITHIPNHMKYCVIIFEKPQTVKFSKQEVRNILWTGLLAASSPNCWVSRKPPTDRRPGRSGGDSVVDWRGVYLKVAATRSCCVHQAYQTAGSHCLVRL